MYLKLKRYRQRLGLLQSRVNIQQKGKTNEDGGAASTSSSSPSSSSASSSSASSSTSIHPPTSSSTSPPPPPPPPKQPFYIAALDLEKCYDNVDTARLYNLIHRLLAQPSTPPPFHHDKGEVGIDDDDHVAEDHEDLPIASDEEYTIYKYSVTHYVPSLERVVSKPVRWGWYIPC